MEWKGYHAFLISKWSVHDVYGIFSKSTDSSVFVQAHTEYFKRRTYISPSLQFQINIIIFILALRNALSSSHIAATSTSESNTGTTKATVDEILRKVKIGLRGFAVLLPLLGLTWVFGLLVFNRDTIVFKYLFAICNSLQGVVIFVFHVLVNRKVFLGLHLGPDKNISFNRVNLNISGTTKNTMQRTRNYL